MGKTINFSEAKAQAKKVILSSEFTLNCQDRDGKDQYIELTGDETISTTCPVCGEQFTLSLEDFINIMAEGDLYGTSIHCLECSKKRW